MIQHSAQQRRRRYQTRFAAVAGFRITAPLGRAAIVASLTVSALSTTLTLGEGAAQAQTVGDLPDAAFHPTRGVFVPGAARAGEADATAVELNPGQLPLLSNGAAAVVGDLWRSQAAMPGRGAALYLGAPLWGAGGIGLALQGLAGDGVAGTSAHTKFQLGYGIGGPKFGLGASWAHLFGGGVAGVDTFDAGLGWRPFSGLAAALVLEDVARPRLPGAADALPRRWIGELAIRPLGTDRLEMAAAALHLGGDPWSRSGMRFRAVARVGAVWRLFADVEENPRRAGALSAVAAAPGTDWRTTAGLMVDLDHGSVALAASRSFVPAGATGENWGGSAIWRVSAEQNRASVGVVHAVRISLDGVNSDREFLNLALRLRRIARDTTTDAVLLKVNGVDLGLGRIEELRDLISEIRERGKKVVAYLTDASMREVYLASACDRVVIHPAGGMTFAGLAQAVTFYKGAMERLGINVELVRIAEFKGAMEPYVMTSQSEPVRENRNQLLDDIYARLLAGVVSGRAPALASASSAPPVTLDGARLVDLMNRGTFTPEEARRAGLVDAVRDDHETEKYLGELMGRATIDIRDPDRAPVHSPRWVRPRIAVILLDGTISEGSSQHLPFDLGGVAGADTLVEALEECRRDSSIRAVVLRVNSPGGSAFSSDVIARAVSRVRAAGKPVVASMGDVAASGGYYVSAPADVILAEPSTTTGSIGIFGFKLDLARLFSMLSLNVEVLRRGPHADQQALYRPWTAEERLIAEQKIRHLYDLFVETVATGRKSRGMTTAAVDRIGRGHVWTGAQARDRGLVDEFGGVVVAVDRAAALGRVPLGVDEAPELIVLPRPSKTILQAVAGFAQAASDSVTGDAATTTADLPQSPKLAPALRSALRLVAPYVLGPGEGIEARLPYDLDVR